jgi:hypothetical protein
VTLAQAPDGDIVMSGDYNGTAGFFLARFKLAPRLYLELQPDSNTGLKADNVTFAQHLLFDVHNVDAAYRVYRNGVLISNLYETDPVFTALDQPEGTWDYTLTALDAAGNESGPSQSVRVAIDRTPPTVTSMVFNRDPAGQSIRMTFSEDISASLAPADLLLVDEQGTVIPASSIALVYDLATNTAVFTFPGLPRGILPDGRYTVSLFGSPITDVAGNPLVDPPWQIAQLRGDLNLDGLVDRADLAMLIANMGQTDLTGELGDLNGDRLVGFVDFQIFELAFGNTL